jgi:hypothetical protein
MPFGSAAVDKRRKLIYDAIRLGAVVHQEGKLTRIHYDGMTVRIFPNGKALLEGSRFDNAKAVRNFNTVRKILGLKPISKDK